MDTQQNPQQLEQTQSTSRQKWTKVFVPLATLVLLLLTGYIYSQNSNDNSVINNKQVAVSQEEKAAQVPEGERQELEAKIKVLNDQIKGFTAQTTVGDQYRAYLQLGALKHRLGLYDDAIAALDKIPDEKSGIARVYISYALIYKDKGDWIKSAENAKKALDLDPENQQYWVVYLESEQSLSNADREAKYKEAIEKTDSHEDVLVSYAKFLEKIGNIQGAIEQYKKAGETNQKEKPQFDAEITRLEAK